MASNDQKFALLEDNIGIKEPVHLAQAWFDEALANPKILFPKAMCLSTASKSGIPSSRMVLLNDISDRGLTFFTNYGSHKAQEIEENSYVAVTLFWPPNSTQIRQLRVEGKAEKISRIESEKNFHQRPRAVQIGTLSCPQSTRIPSRQYLEQLDRSVEEEFAPDKEIPLPNWGGYLIVPHLIEFGQGEGHRMHDRIQFRKIANPDGETDGELVHKGANGWVYERLAP